VPRAKPSKVETIRFELGSWERTHIEGVLHSQTLDKYSEALTQLLTLEKMYLLVTIVEVITGREILWGTPNDLNDLIASVRDWWKVNKEEFGEEGLWGYLGLGRKPMTAEEEARIRSQAEVWANAFGITVDPATGEVSDYEGTTYTSAGDVWAQAFGVNLND